MIRRTLLLSCLLAGTILAQTEAKPRREPVRRPKLLVGIVIDQFRYDYINRWRAQYKGGFARFFERGAVFTNAHHEHFPTVTAIGHSTFMSGATPSTSGIVGNSWYDRTTGKNVTSVSDESVKLLGGEGRGSSPHRLIASTVSDELKIAGRQSRVVGISIKDRSAILPVGHTADGAYWFDGASGNFVSSTWYFPDLPGWVKEYNASRPGDKFAGKEWRSLEDGNKLFRTMATAADARLYNSIEASPFGNEIIEEFAERAVDAEKLGTHADTDVLCVSFSANDYVGHAMGPDAPEVRDMALRTDLVLDKLFQYLDKKVGLDNVLIVLTADHGVGLSLK